MNQDDVTAWIESAGKGDDLAAYHLWEHCFPKLLRYAQKKLPDRLRRAMDEEDVALSALKSFFSANQRGAFPDLASRDDLWKLLVCIAARKAQARVRHETRKKRGGGFVQGESIFITGSQSGDPSPGIAGIESTALNPELLAQFSDEFETLMNALSDDTQRTIAILRIEGYAVAEISERVACAVRTVERKLNLIRRTWTEVLQNEFNND